MIYADNAATSYPKPPQVVAEMVKAVEVYGANPGRSGHFMSRMAEDMVFNCRKAVAKLFNAKEENVVFTSNATKALNIAILGSVTKNDHVIISDLEHNAVYRPLVAAGCEISFLKTEDNNYLTLCNLKNLIKENTKAVILTAASNLTGKRLPLKEIGAYLKDKKILFITDASQGAGHFKIDMEECNINILCAPGHKGLLGAQGSGVMVLRNALPAPLTFGGTGNMSASLTMPELPPERFEAGTLNTPAIASLLRGIEFIEKVGIGNIEAYEKSLALKLYENLSKIKGIELLERPMGGLVAFNIENKSSEEVALFLSDNGVLVRGGLHCAPLAHKKYNTMSTGAVRISLGCFNNAEQIKKITQIIKKLI